MLLTSWTSAWGSQELQTDLKRDTYVSRNSDTKMSHTNLSVSKCHLFSVCGPSLCPGANGHRINTEMLWSYQTDTFLRLIASLDSGGGKEKIPKNVTRLSASAALFQRQDVMLLLTFVKVQVIVWIQHWGPWRVRLFVVVLLIWGARSNHRGASLCLCNHMTSSFVSYQ